MNNRDNNFHWNSGNLMKIHLSGASDLAFSTSVGPSMCLQPVMASSLARPRAKTGPLQKKQLITILIVNSNKKRKRDIKKSIVFEDLANLVQSWNSPPLYISWSSSSFIFNNGITTRKSTLHTAKLYCYF